MALGCGFVRMRGREVKGLKGKILRFDLNF